MQKKVLLVTPGLCGVCKNLSILLAIRQCGVRNKISELFLLCFLLGAALESLYIGDKTICPPTSFVHLITIHCTFLCFYGLEGTYVKQDFRNNFHKTHWTFTFYFDISPDRQIPDPSTTLAITCGGGGLRRAEPHQCTHSTKLFVIKSNLRTHMLIHAGRKYTSARSV